MLKFSASNIEEFRKHMQTIKDSRRTGQVFHQYMELDKMRGYKNYRDLIYELDGESFWKFISEHIDYGN